MLKTRVRVTSCFLWAVLTYLGFYSPNTANAETQYGVNVTVYNDYGYDNSPPLPPDRPIVGTLVQSQVLNNFDQESLFGMYEDFVVKYEGHIAAPCTCDVRFTAQADDGTKLYLNGSLITDDWYDKGGGGTVSEPVHFDAGVSKEFLMWFYENGGGAWTELWWDVTGEWQVVPASAFTVQTLNTTTTTSTSTTSTTVPETTTTSTVAQVVVPPTTLPVPPTTQVTVSTSSSTTIAPTTTVAQVPVDVTKITDAQAIALATNAEILKTLTGDEAATVFDAVQVNDLSNAQADELVAAVQNAPTEVRVSFENEINIFGGKFDKYVPIGSKINVRQRKVLVAATGVIFVAPTVSSTSGSSSNSRKRKI